MADFILLMHDDTTRPLDESLWEPYFATLRAAGGFGGGSSIGAGASLRKDGPPAATTDQLAGYIRVRADSLEEAKRLVPGNPVYECGGTVEVRTLPEG